MYKDLIIGKMNTSTRGVEDLELYLKHQKFQD